RGSYVARKPGVGRVLSAREALDRRALVVGEAVGPELEPVLALEPRGQRRRRVVELRPVTERGLERGQARQRIVGRREDGGQAVGAPTRAGPPVAPGRCAVAPLRAADELTPADLDLAAAGAGEAEGRRRLVAASDTDHLDRRAEGPEPRGQRGTDPLIAVEQ